MKSKYAFMQEKLDNFKSRFDNDIQEVAGQYADQITVDNILLYREMARTFLPTTPEFDDVLRLVSIVAPPELKLEAYIANLPEHRRNLLRDYVMFFLNN